MSRLLTAQQMPTAADIWINRLIDPSKFGTNPFDRGRDAPHFQLCGFNQRLIENLSPAIRTFRWRFQNVIRHARIGSGDAVENIIEWNLSTFVVAMLA